MSAILPKPPVFNTSAGDYADGVPKNNLSCPLNTFLGGFEQKKGGL
jgi:hypothetical protein